MGARSPAEPQPPREPCPVSLSSDARLESALRAGLEAAGAPGGAGTDVLTLREHVLRAAPDLLAGREGLLHAALHRLLQRGAVRVAGTTARGLPGYAANGHGEPAAPGEYGPRASAHDPVAVALSRAVRDPAARVRVLVDVDAHRQALAEAGASAAFGSAAQARVALRRVDRRQRTVLLALTGGERVKRFLVHEGPWIVCAVGLFVVVKLFFADVFVIPSDSMVPTLIQGDRVVVVKKGSGWRPERWQVVTFHHPGPDGPRTTYVKRVVGLPGEAVSLWHGDVYADGVLQVKPEALSAALRHPLQHWAFPAGPEAAGWRAERSEAGVEHWSPVRDPVRAGGRFGGVLLDLYAELDVELLPDGAAEVVHVRGADDTFRGAVVRLTLEAGRVGVRLREERRSATPGVVPASRTLWEVAGPRSGAQTLRLAVVDGVVHASVGEHTWSRPLDLPAGAAQVGFTTVGRGVRPTAFRLDQDLHYGTSEMFGGAGPVARPTDMQHRLAPDALFMLGDNTHNSNDSRRPDMGDIRLGDLIGPVLVRIWPLGRIGSVR